MGDSQHLEPVENKMMLGITIKDHLQLIELEALTIVEELVHLLFKDQETQLSKETNHKTKIRIKTQLEMLEDQDPVKGHKDNKIQINNQAKEAINLIKCLMASTQGR